ncbi:arginine N-succinyltransferase [Desulforhopalus vacuolatus]|uniref:arginine N-succinyltransferase n=1 Tax=Desulforhopalus vacuolatus TaxID=40414 RepID=UPI001962E2D0|nr:arginine N-succinyltransferase [Desulforhopalus vacuolatus]MBM9519989.1 arginine N-succinyltransferase [Desulforhopalus vacuolatus]
MKQPSEIKEPFSPSLHLQPEQQRRGFKWSHLILMMLAVMVVTAAVTGWIIKSTFFASPLQPVVLTSQEQTVLDNKLAEFEGSLRRTESTPAKRNPTASTDDDEVQNGVLQPEKYSEEGASRTINLTEREVNALLANNTDLANKVAVDFSDDMVSLRIRLSLDKDVPVLGGKTLKIKAGARLTYENGHPVVIIKGVSLMGLPVPAAWLGGLKNVDLVEQSGAADGFWKQFAAGVTSLKVTDGALQMTLAE